MVRRFLRKLPRRTLQVVGGLLLLGVVVFFGLTRTEVGRERLKTRIEAQFDARFAGRLHIGRLTGNLVGTVHARGVRLDGPDGRTVLSVDSVRAVPRWRSLLGQEVFFSEVELIDPRVRLARSEGGTWNVERAFRRTVAHDTSGGGFALRFADVVLQNADVRTENRGSAPRLVRSGWLFDYANAHLRGVNARLSVERAPGDGLQIDLHRLRGRLAGLGVPIEEARGQIAVSDSGLALRQLRLELGRTRLGGSFSVERRGRAEAPALHLDLAESRLDHDEIRRLVPRWPLRGTTTAALAARGPLDRLRVSALRIERGASALRAEGTVRGLPDDLLFDLDFADSRLTAADLRAVLPGLPPAPLARLARLGTVRFDLGAEGRLTGLSGTAERALRASARFDVRTDVGALRGTADVTRRAGQPLAYAADVRAENFDAGRLGANAAGLPSRLTGSLAFSGTGLSAEGLAGTLEARLERSVIAGRPLDGLEVDLQAAGAGRLSGTATLRQPQGGALYVSGAVERGVPSYDLTARAKRFDLGALLGRDALATALTGTAEIDGRGAALGALAGRLRLHLTDSTTLVHGGTRRVLPPLDADLTLAAPGEPGPRIALRSAFADLTVNGEADLSALRAVGRLWGRAFADAFQEAYRKPYAAHAGTREASPGTAPRPSAEAKQAVRQALEAAGVGRALDAQAELSLKQPAALRAFFPALAGLSDPVDLHLALEAGAEALSAEGTLEAAMLHDGRLCAAGIESQFRARASLAAPLLQTLDASFDASADTLGIGGTRFLAPALAAGYRERTGDVQLSTSAAGGSGRLQLGAGLRLLPDRNRLRVRTLRLAAGEYVWHNDDASPVDLYADAVAVPGLTLVSENGTGAQPQRVTLRGVLSAAPSDTLGADLSRVRLRSLSQLLGLRRSIGGRLDAQLHWTGSLRAPQLTGRLDVSRLAFDDRLLGRLTVRSRYMPGTPGIGFEAQLRPGGRDSSAASALRWEENRLSARGTVDIPGLGADQRDGGGSSDAGALDLALDVGRADLFFFDYLFDGQITDAAGAIAGTGHIGGTFRKPLFEADLQISDGSFRVQRFGLRYAAEGNVSVDREGIKIGGARVRDPDGGSARVEGALLFNDYDYFSFDLNAALDELQIINVDDSPDLPFYGEIAASGPVRLTGPLSDARLFSDRVRTTPESELVLPIGDDEAGGGESGFLIFADSTGGLPDLRDVTQRESILDDRPAGERTFVDGLDLDLGIAAPQGSTVRLVFDPLLGDEITAVGGGQIQLLREEGALSLFGTFDVDSGRYLFTAGQVFQRRFQIEEGTLRWDGPAANAQIDLTAAYRTRASRAGLPGADERTAGRIPILVRLGIDGRVQQPSVDLSLAVDQTQRGFDNYSTAGLETILNSGDRSSEYATSVLLTNTFLLTTDLAGRSGSQGQGLSETSNRLAFNSVSQLVSSQLNRYLNEALPNLDVNLGVQGEDPQDLDVIYGVALRLLDERLVIRGEGVLDGQESRDQRPSEGFEGEFVVEVRLTPRISAEAFYRREGSLLSESALTSTTGAGLSYQTEFSTWRQLWHRLFGWLGVDDPEAPPLEGDAPVASGE